MKRRMADGTVLDTRLLKGFIGWADEYAEMYLPEEAKRDRLAQIAELESLIEEFRDTDKDSYEFAISILKHAKGAFNEFVGYKFFSV